MRLSLCGRLRKGLLFLPLVLSFVLAGCGPSDDSQTSGSGGDSVAGWTFTSGKRPSRAEYAALVASCQQGAVRLAQGRSFEPGKSLEACLADLGLRKE